MSWIRITIDFSVDNNASIAQLDRLAAAAYTQVVEDDEVKTTDSSYVVEVVGT